MSNLEPSKSSAGGTSSSYEVISKEAGLTTRSFYRGYMLTCQPMRLDDGSYQARVAITSMQPDKTRAQRFLDLDPFESHEASVEGALRAGMDWVDTNG